MCMVLSFSASCGTKIELNDMLAPTCMTIENDIQAAIICNKGYVNVFGELVGLLFTCRIESFHDSTSFSSL